MSLKNQKSIKPALVLPQGARVLQIHPGFVQKVSRPPSSLSDAMSTVSTLGATAQGATMDKPKRKRQRLDHLSQEEKIMRRKLKNRMAAQSARDRKKVKMLDLEGECVRIASTNERLVKRNAHLEKELRNLKAENALLRRRLEMSDLEPVSSSTVGDDLLKELMASTGLDALKHEEINEEELEEYYDDDQSDELSECDSGHESLEPSSSSPSSSVSGGSPAAHRAQHRPALAPGHAHSTNAILDDSFESAEGSRTVQSGGGRAGGGAGGGGRGGAAGCGAGGRPQHHGRGGAASRGNQLHQPARESAEPHFHIASPEDMLGASQQTGVTSMLDEQLDQFAIDELFDSLVQSLDAEPGRGAGARDGADLCRTGGDGLLGGAEPLAESQTVEQLFASIDASLELCRDARSGAPGAQALLPPSATADLISADHDYFRRDYNNNHLPPALQQPDLFLTSPTTENLLQSLNSSQYAAKKLNPLSPLSNSSSDFGYESDHKSPLGVPLEFEDEYLINLGLMDTPMLDEDPFGLDVFADESIVY